MTDLLPPRMNSDSYLIRLTFVDVDINPKRFDEDAKAWISFEFMNCIIQSDIFHLSNSKSFIPFSHDFDFQGSHYQLEQTVLNKQVTINLCGDDQLYAKFLFQPKNLMNRVTNDISSITFDFLDADNQSIGALFVDLEVHKSKHNLIDSNANVVVTQDLSPFSHSDRNHYEREQKLALAEAELERKIKDSITRQAKAEAAFLQHIRKKEDAVRLIFENQTKKIEDEKVIVLSQYREEYKKLEGRLKAALNEIEAKEREMNRQLSEMKIKQSVLKEESQNAVDNERSKSNMLQEQLVKERSKIQRLEDELTEVRLSYQASAQAKAENELIIMTRQLQELEIKLSKADNELQVMLTEKDHYRQAAHKLAKLMREQRSVSSKLTNPTTQSIPLSIRTGSKKNSEKLINLKAELSKISLDMEST